MYPVQLAFISFSLKAYEYIEKARKGTVLCGEIPADVMKRTRSAPNLLLSPVTTPSECCSLYVDICFPHTCASFIFYF